MIYTIEKYGYKLEIADEGAYLNELSLCGENIIFPKQIIEIDGEEKLRGGSHICLPQFSDGSRKNLDFHGFARMMTWDLLIKTDEKIVLELKVNDGDYKGLIANIEYLISKDGLKTILNVRNNSDKSFEICPAFHPYFNIGDSKTLVINNEKIDPRDLQYYLTAFKDSVSYFATDKFEINYLNENLNTFALWTDLKGDYFCVEPTYNSVAFSQGIGFINLEKNQEMNFSYELKINLK